jgi:hypothetical protein
MKKIKLGKKEYKIYFAMQPTLQSGLLPKIAAVESVEAWGLDNIDKLFDLIAEMLLIGLQKEHKDEFEFNYLTGEGKGEMISKVYSLLDDYSESEDANFFDLYNSLNEELTENSFFAKMFRQELEKAKAEQNSEK